MSTYLLSEVCKLVPVLSSTDLYGLKENDSVSYIQLTNFLIIGLVRPRKPNRNGKCGNSGWVIIQVADKKKNRVTVALDKFFTDGYNNLFMAYTKNDVHTKLKASQLGKEKK